MVLMGAGHEAIYWGDETGFYKTRYGWMTRQECSCEGAQFESFSGGCTPCRRLGPSLLIKLGMSQPITGTRCPTLFDKWYGMFYRHRETETDRKGQREKQRQGYRNRERQRDRDEAVFDPDVNYFSTIVY